MPRTMTTMVAQRGGRLGDIRRDKERKKLEFFERLKAELVHAFAAPDSSYRSLTAEEVIARNRV